MKTPQDYREALETIREYHESHHKRELGKVAKYLGSLPFANHMISAIQAVKRDRDFARMDERAKIAEEVCATTE